MGARGSSQAAKGDEILLGRYERLSNIDTGLFFDYILVEDLTTKEHFLMAKAKRPLAADAFQALQLGVANTSSHKHPKILPFVQVGGTAEEAVLFCEPRAVAGSTKCSRIEPVRSSICATARACCSI